MIGWGTENGEERWWIANSLGKILVKLAISKCVMGLESATLERLSLLVSLLMSENTHKTTKKGFPSSSIFFLPWYPFLIHNQMCGLLPMNQLIPCYQCNPSREGWGLLHGNDTLFFFWLLDSFSFSHIPKYEMRYAFQSSCESDTLADAWLVWWFLEKTVSIGLNVVLSDSDVC